MAAGAPVGLERGELLRVGQFAVPEQPGDFLEAAMLGQLLHRVAEIDERVDFRHHLGDARGVHDDAVQAAVDSWFVSHNG